MCGFSRCGTDWEIGETIYKNSAMEYGKPGYFETRYLDLTAKAHAAMAARIAELATPEALDAFVACREADRSANIAAERKAARVAYLKKCVAAIQTANADDLAAAMRLS